MYYSYNADVQATYETSQPEYIIAGLRDGGIESRELSRPRSYAGVLMERPGVNLGLDGAREQASLHVLQGFY